jgi:tetratricopeptide (TPR) repeat protein
VHRAEIMQLRGSWADAEREARRACEELSGYDLRFSGEAHYEIGEVRLRVGDLDGAKEAFRQAGELSRDPEPGRSLLRLAQGNAQGANTSIKWAVAAVESFPVIEARLLPAAVEIGLAARDLDAVAQYPGGHRQLPGTGVQCGHRRRAGSAGQRMDEACRGHVINGPRNSW